ncbi:MAG TPA: hypothetical protein VKM55_07360 [Candidatus Lokiarchaeia archaeon]|nr:hypothetical protein [Candidatus Lokiarchaeia archaeon]
MAQPVARKVVVDVPHRISGFFKIVDHTLPLDYGLDDLLSIGSRGGGPCLSECGVTAIEIDEHGESGSVKIFINGEDCADGAKTTRSVLKWMAGEAVNDIAITIKHDFPMLMGAGYGSSGSGALGTAIALNVLLDMGLSLNDCGKFAHCAEVENKTGLGTIGGQVRGGCTISIAPGFPFTMETIILPPGIKIACATRGGLSTAQMLSDPDIRTSIIASGKTAMASIVEHFTIEHFTRIAIDFVNSTWMQFLEQLDLGAVKNVMDAVNSDLPEGILGASMNQMGKSVYCIYRASTDAEEYIDHVFVDNGFDEVKFLDFNTCGPSIRRIE